MSLTTTDIVYRVVEVENKSNLPSKLDRAKIYFTIDTGGIYGTDKHNNAIKYCDLNDTTNAINKLDNDKLNRSDIFKDVIQAYITSSITENDERKVASARSSYLLNEKINTINATLPIFAEKTEIPKIIDNLNSTNTPEGTSSGLSAYQGNVLNGKINALNTEVNKKLNADMVIDSVAESVSKNKTANPLSANQGYLLNENIKTKASQAQVTTLNNDFMSLKASLQQAGVINTNNNPINIKSIIYDDISFNMSDSNLSQYASSARISKVIYNLVNQKLDKSQQITVVDNLTTNDNTKALSAKQGVILLDMINKETDIATIDQYNTGNVLLGAPAVGWASLLGQDYTYTLVNDYGKPITITYSDGTICNLTYRTDGQLDSYIVKGYKVTYNYNSNNYFIGKTTTKI